MTHPHHHQHIRKRKAPFPHPVKWKRYIDYLVMAMGIGNIFATLPQVLEVWLNKSAGDVSYITWGYYTVFAAVLCIYGVVHGERPIIITYLFGFILNGLVTVGAIIYQ